VNELEGQGDFAGALAVIDQAMKQVPDSPILWRAKGRVFERVNRINEALQALSKAIELASANTNAFGNLLTDARLNRASLLRQLNRIEEAIADNLAACGIPPRSPQAGPEQIDLGLVYNRELISYHNIPRDSAAANTMPGDVRKVTGVAFDLRGLVRLAGTNWVQMGHEPGPHSANGIPVGRPFARMHVVHSATKAETDGVAIGAYVLHYADGQQQALPIIYGEHLRERDSPAKTEMRAPNSAVVCWSYRAQNGWTPRLYETTYENPRPEVAVKSIDFVSNLTKSAPFLVAITVEP
jgi:tetratricopeptide (TPR) repeat protein